MVSHHNTSNLKLLEQPLEVLTFIINKQSFGIEVQAVQEIVQGIKVTEVSLAPAIVAGLLNLRGKVITSLDIAAILGIDSRKEQSDTQIVCDISGHRLAFLVEEIGDVYSIEPERLKSVPAQMDKEKAFLRGVSSNQGRDIWVLDVEFIYREMDLQHSA